MIPVILSGGSGTRLWPVSRQKLPKQFCDLFEDSLQAMTLKRCAPLGSPWIVTGKVVKTQTEINMRQANVHAETLYEPFGKNTAPAIASLCKVLMDRGLGEEAVAIFPSDHLVRNEGAFIEVIKFGEKVAQTNKIVTIGITPTYPESGYGYIQTKNAPIAEQNEFKAFSVVKFHEKPSLEKAKEFLMQDSFSWNAGIFIFKVNYMAQLFKLHQPAMWSLIQNLNKDISNIEDVYQEVQNISIDYAIMEKLTENELVCIPADLGWSDVGSWDAMLELRESAPKIEVKGKDNFVFGIKEKSYSFVGLDEVIVVDTQDALMLVKKGHSQDVRHVVELVQKINPKIVKEHVYEYRPWGDFEILRDTASFKSKVIHVNAHSQISYQSHAQREEHWIITKGSGEVILNDKVIAVKAGSHIHIPTNAKHRIRNSTDSVLEFVEVQLGTYFGEDDIIRYEDDYKRT